MSESDTSPQSLPSESSAPSEKPEAVKETLGDALRRTVGKDAAMAVRAQRAWLYEPGGPLHKPRKSGK